jgi:hypothetical protein
MRPTAASSPAVLKARGVEVLSSAALTPCGTHSSFYRLTKEVPIPRRGGKSAWAPRRRRRSKQKRPNNWTPLLKKERTNMAVPDSNAESNKFDVSGDNGLWVDPHGRDQSLGATTGGKRMTEKPVALDGELDHENAFRDAGSDANRGNMQGTSLPPWAG